MLRRASSRIILAFLLTLFIMPFGFQHNMAEPIFAQSFLPLSGEVHLSVPFYFQEKNYYCGPAALEMVFSFYGENVSQSEIACVARSIGDPLYVTYTDELRRAGQFSNISTSMGDELPDNITGYTLRKLGYAASEAQGMNLITLRNFLDQGKPLVLLMWYNSNHVSTHYRVVTGYNGTHVFLHDPWNKPLWGGTYGGPNIAFSNSQFLDLWSYFNYWALYISPWIINFSTPAYVPLGTPFQVQSTITYPQTLPNAFFTYPASSCNASINLPANLSLAQGESPKKTVGVGLLQAGNSSSLSWTLVANSSVTGSISVTAEGLISGSVSPIPNYAAYSYDDRIGATVNFTINLPSALHNVAVTNVIPSKNIVGQAFGLNVTVTIKDLGSYAEGFNITIFTNDTALQTEGTSLASGVSINMTFVSNTSGLVCGNYTMSASVTAVPNETNIRDNTFTDGTILVTIPGDINGDFQVSLTDLVLLANAYGSHPSNAKWNPNADLNGNGAVDLADLVILAQHYGQHYP